MFSRLAHTIAALPKPTSPKWTRASFIYNSTDDDEEDNQGHDEEYDDDRNHENEPIYPWTSAPRSHIRLHNQSSNIGPPKKKKTTLMTLPTELRLQIVDYLRLCPTEEWQMCRNALVALSETSKSMRSFIGPLIFSKISWSYRQGLVEGSRREFWDVAETFPQQFLKDVKEVSISLTDWSVKADMGWMSEEEEEQRKVMEEKKVEKEEERWRFVRINYLITCFNFLRRLLKKSDQIKSLSFIAGSEYDHIFFHDTNPLLVPLLASLEPISHIENLYISTNEYVAERIVKFFSSTLKTLHAIPTSYHDPSPAVHLRSLSKYTFQYVSGVDIFEYVQKARFRPKLHPPSHLTHLNISYRGNDLSAFIPFWPIMSIIFASEETLETINIHAALIVLEREKPLEEDRKQSKAKDFLRLKRLKISLILLKDPTSLTPIQSKAAAIEADPWIFFRYFSKAPVEEIWYQRFSFEGSSGSFLRDESSTTTSGYTKSSNFDYRVPISIGLTRGEGKNYWTELKLLRFPETLELAVRDELELELSLRSIKIVRKNW